MFRRVVLAVAALVPLLVAAGPCGPQDECARDADCIGNDICVDGECLECEDDGDCDDDEQCDDGDCEPLGAEGEGDPGEGEGEPGEGEGEGDPGEGEGEGELPGCTSRCDCAVGESCFLGICQVPPGFCLTDEECPRGAAVCAETVCLGLVCGPAEGEGEGE